MLSSFISSAQNAVVMNKLENKLEALNILINTEKGHPALLKFVTSGGISPLFEMCCKINLSKNQSENYHSDLQLFQKLVAALKNLPISPKVLTDTKIGRGVNKIVKEGIFKTESIHETALNLVNYWKSLVST